MQRAVAGLALLALTAAARAQRWEPMQADYRNLRGICYLAVYPSREGAVDYYGDASPTAMWYEYDAHPNAIPIAPTDVPQGTAGSVYEQLGWVAKMGINTVRVWLSFPLWEHYHDNPTGPTNEYIDRLRHFARICEKHRLRLIPVLWDSLEIGGPIDYTNPIGVSMRSYWHATPEPARLHAMVQQDPTLVGTRAGQYLVETISALDSSPALLMWDVMNEPRLHADEVQFIRASMAIIKQHAVRDTTLFGVFWAEDRFPLAGTLARDPNLDVMAIHPYGQTRANIEAPLWDATHVSDGAGGFVQKPVVATEIGKPGWALSYRDALAFATGVPRPDLGPNKKGIGFTPWTAMIGFPGGNYPFKETDGIFFSDGQVREREVVFQFLEVARAQGLRDPRLFRPEEVHEFSGSGRVVQELPTEVDDWDYLAKHAWQPVTTLEQMSWDELRRLCAVFRMVSVFIDVGPLSAAANPINDPTITGNVLDPADLATILFSIVYVWPESSPIGISVELRDGLTQMMGVPFDPQNNAAHRVWMVRNLVDSWRLALLPYLVYRRGPYGVDNR